MQSSKSREVAKSKPKMVRGSKILLVTLFSKCQTILGHGTKPGVSQKLADYRKSYLKLTVYRAIV